MPNDLLSNRTSCELLRRARNGDDEAAGRLFARYMPKLTTWAHGRLPRWARGALDTADLVQDAVLNTFDRLRTFESRHEGALLSYLRRALRNRIVDHLRYMKSRRVEPLEGNQATSHDSPFDTTLSNQSRERYWRALRQLKPQDRQAIVARLELDYSYEQLALLLNKPTPVAARLAVRRALLRLAREMQNER